VRLSEPEDMLTGGGIELRDHASVLDFWRWSYSILSNDPTKGEFAEWMVAKLLGMPTPPGGRIEGANWDLLSSDGVRIEVKAAAYWQAWKLRDQVDGSWRAPTQLDFEKLTKIKFAGLHRRPSTGTIANADFKADLYIFCLQHEKDTTKWNGVDLSQWAFFALEADKLKELKNRRDAAYASKPLPKSFDLSLLELEKHTRRMTAKEFCVAGPKLISMIASGKQQLS